MRFGNVAPEQGMVYREPRITRITLISTSPVSAYPCYLWDPWLKSSRAAKIFTVHFNRGKVFVRNVLTHAEYARGNWQEE